MIFRGRSGASGRWKTRPVVLTLWGSRAADGGAHANPPCHRWPRGDGRGRRRPRFAQADSSTALPTITVPTPLLYGAADVRAPRPVAEALPTAIPTSELVLLAAEEHTLLAVRPAETATLTHRLRPSPYLAVLPVIGQPGRPAADLRATDALLTGHAARARRPRIVNQEPSVPGRHWHEWRRPEAVVNVALQRHHAWAVCVYDRQALPDDRVEDLRATHPLIWSTGQHRRNDHYQDPVRFLAARTAPPDPVEQTPPALELINPSPAAAPAAITRLTRRSRLFAEDGQGLALATTEAVVNANVHGHPPTVLRSWTQPERVTDTGAGPTDPFVGLLAAGHPDRQPPDPGLGLWIIHQMVDVAHRRHPDGYTIRITATTPRPPAP
jgi:anti-sigma regulatory factor (Ser/Thr protein kinase)